MERSEKKKIGRPRRARYKAMQVTIYIDLDTLEAADEAAEKAGLSRSQWINKVIKEKLGME